MVFGIDAGASALLRPTPHIPGMDNFIGTTVLLSVGLPLVIFGVVFFTVVLPLIRRSAQRQRLLATGEQAQAKILGLADTGVKINNNPQLQIQLEVYPQTRPPFQTQCITTVSFLAIPRIQPGMMVMVRFDPANPAAVALEM